MMRDRKGFTLIELLAVIVILALLMAFAIPSVTKYIESSRKETVVDTIGGYISSITVEVNNRDYQFSTPNTIYAVPLECIELERGGDNPFGEWLQANSAYWAYVLIEYDSDNFSYNYGFTFKDSAGYGLYPTLQDNIDISDINVGYDDLSKPESGDAVNFILADKWNGFNVTSMTQLVVLEAESEGVKGDGKETCALCQKGSNYDEVEEEKIKKLVPQVSLNLSVNTENGKIVITGKFDNYDKSSEYYDVTEHGILFIQSSRIGTRVMTLNTSGRTKVSFSGYKEDGSFVYNLLPSSATTSYTVRAFLTYIDPITGKSVTVYSNHFRGSYNSIFNSIT